MRLSFLAIPALLATPAFAQSGDIPAEVIAQCNVVASATELPDCLKEGATAVEMFELARSSEFYGAAAEPVLEACGVRNETFSNQWTCFQNAAQKAAETRELIGSENIADACVAGISDPDIAIRIDQNFKLKRKTRFPDEMFFGGGMYYAFQGCPTEGEKAEVEEGGAPPSDTDAVGDALGAALGDAKSEEPYSEEACAAYADIGDLIKTKTTDELRVIALEMKEREDLDAAGLVSMAGLSDKTAAFLETSGQDEGQGMVTLFTIAAYVETHHPVLIDELMHQGKDGAPGPEDALAKEMASGLVSVMIGGARENYEASCAVK
ncbi:MAG: hypothetical protein ACU0A4_17195 [Paracoccaceae bacterium]